LPVDLVVVVLLEGAGSHGSRVGVPGLPACAYPTPYAAVVNRQQS
jgi:hypothetical protein